MTTMSDQARVAIDFPGLRIGIADYPEGPTGCTVLVLPRRSALAVDLRGGAISVLNGHYQQVDALCLAGGSAFGLDAGGGVADGLRVARGDSTRWTDIPLVSGAIIYDFAVRDSIVYPDKALGRRAFETATAGWVPVGPVGAGRSATVGKMLLPDRHGEPAGQGAAFAIVDGRPLLVLTVVNAVGAVHDRTGRVVRGHIRPGTTGTNPGTGPERIGFAEAWRAGARPAPPGGNTTLTVVVTDRALDRPALVQTGRQVHDAMARAIRPFHTLNDGDVLFMVATGAAGAGDLHPIALAEAAAELAWDAVLTCWAGAVADGG